MFNSSLFFKEDNITSHSFLFNPTTGTDSIGTNVKKPEGKDNGNNSNELATAIANGISSKEELLAFQKENFFASNMRGENGGYVSSEQIQNTTQTISNFNNAYREFSSNPCYESAKVLKNEYLNAKDTNKSIVQLYKLVEPKVESLLATKSQIETI